MDFTDSNSRSANFCDTSFLNMCMKKMEQPYNSPLRNHQDQGITLSANPSSSDVNYLATSGANELLTEINSNVSNPVVSPNISTPIVRTAATTSLSSPNTNNASETTPFDAITSEMLTSQNGYKSNHTFQTPSSSNLYTPANISNMLANQNIGQLNNTESARDSSRCFNGKPMVVEPDASKLLENPPLCSARPNSRECSFSPHRDKKDGWFEDLMLSQPVDFDIPEADKKILEIGNLTPRSYCLRTQLRSSPTEDISNERSDNILLSSHCSGSLPVPNICGSLPWLPPPSVKRMLGAQLKDSEYASSKLKRKPLADVSEMTRVVNAKQQHPFDKCVLEHMSRAPLSSMDQINTDKLTTPLIVPTEAPSNTKVVKKELPDGGWSGATPSYNLMIKRIREQQLKQTKNSGAVEQLSDGKALTEDDEEAPQHTIVVTVKKAKKRKAHKSPKKVIFSDGLNQEK